MIKLTDYYFVKYPKIKYTMRIAMLCLFVVLAFSCKNQGEPKTSVINSNSASVTYQYKVSGMTCTGCEETIRSCVLKQNGVKSVKVSHEEGEAIVELIPGMTDTSAIKTAINSTGYTVTGIFSFANDSIN